MCVCVAGALLCKVKINTIALTFDTHVFSWNVNAVGSASFVAGLPVKVYTERPGAYYANTEQRPPVLVLLQGTYSSLYIVLNSNMAVDLCDAGLGIDSSESGDDLSLARVIYFQKGNFSQSSREKCYVLNQIECSSLEMMLSLLNRRMFVESLVIREHWILSAPFNTVENPFNTIENPFNIVNGENPSESVFVVDKILTRA